jgi:protocatechuate 3,4-dioxygenase beta subunit
MGTYAQRGITRRHFAQAMLAFPAAGVIGFMGRTSAGAAWAPKTAAELELTPACDDGDDPTPAVTEGPYFKPDSPERRTLVEPDLRGVVITITGRVLTPACAPIAGALLDFWQADEHGVYDNAGFRLRGHQFTDATGRFALTTIVPGPYAGRTRHIHVKAQAPSGEILTTQLYFSGEPRNRSDRLFIPALQLQLHDGPGGKIGAFNFVLRPRTITDTARYNV